MFSFFYNLFVGKRQKPDSDIFRNLTFIKFNKYFTIKHLKKIKRLLHFIYSCRIFFSSFFDCLIFLNSPLSSFSLFHISPSFTLFSSDFSLRFFAFKSSAFLRHSASRLSGRSFTSCSSLLLN